MTKIITAPRVHAFDTTVDAYTAVNSSDDVHDGDVLVIRRERVVGIAVSAWPTAITSEHGAFHTLASDATWSCVGKRPAAHEGTAWFVPADPGTDYRESVTLGERVLERVDMIISESGADYADAADRAAFEQQHNLLP